MFELVWGIFNILVFLYFIFVCIKSIKLVREGLGGLAGLVLVFGLLSFIPIDDSKNLAEKNIDLYNANKLKNVSNKPYIGISFIQSIILEKSLVSNIVLDIQVGEVNKDYEIISAYCIKDGLNSGTKFTIHSLDVKISNNKKYCNYFVSGSLDWKILGIKLFTENKYFEGKIVIKNSEI